MNTNEPYQPHMHGESEQPDDFKAMMIGAVFIFIIAFIPYAVLACCLPQIFGALLAVHLFTSQYSYTLTTGQGIKLGILTCLLGGLSAWVASMGMYFLFDYQVGAKEGEWISLTIAEKVGGAQAVEQAKAAIAEQQAKGLGMLQIGIGLISSILFACISGLIGGSIGAKLFQRAPNNL
jgi:hypothetical protein